MEGNKKITAEPLRGLGGCVEAETEAEEEAPQIKPAAVCNPNPQDRYSECIPTRVTVCKGSVNGFNLSDGRKIAFSQSSITPLSKEDWKAYKLGSIPYAEGNYLIRSANLYAFTGPEFEKRDQEMCQTVKNQSPLITVQHPITDFSARQMRDYLDSHNIGNTEVREGKTQQFILDHNGPADRVSYDYGAEGEFENLSITVQGNAFADSVEHYIEDTDNFSLADLQSFLSNVGAIEITYTEDDGHPEYTIAADREIPPEIEETLRTFAHEYVTGDFTIDPANSDEE